MGWGVYDGQSYVSYSKHNNRKQDMSLAEAGLDTEDTVTRFEVIDETGRILVRYGVRVALSYQDDGRTLKVFMEDRGEE